MGKGLGSIAVEAVLIGMPIVPPSIDFPSRTYPRWNDIEGFTYYSNKSFLSGLIVSISLSFSTLDRLFITFSLSIA